MNNEDMSNEQRAARGLRAVKTHSDFGKIEDNEADEIMTCMGDVLCDMRHLLDTLATDYADGEQRWQLVLERCEMHYSAEVNGE